MHKLEMLQAWVTILFATHRLFLELNIFCWSTLREVISEMLWSTTQACWNKKNESVKHKKLITRRRNADSLKFNDVMLVTSSIDSHLKSNFLSAEV